MNEKKYDLEALRKAWGAGRISALKGEPSTEHADKTIFNWAIRMTKNQPWPFYSDKKWAAMCIRMAEWCRAGALSKKDMENLAKLSRFPEDGCSHMREPAWWGMCFFGYHMRQRVADSILPNETPLQCLKRLEAAEGADK